MNACPHHKLRPDLPPITARIAKLPVDERGYPVPFFVQWLNDKNESSPPGTGRPEFRMMDGAKWMRCVKEKPCWVCGEKLGVHMAFVLGPMCCINKVTAEPPSHMECAQWSVKACPFLSRPKMVRREDDLIRENKANAAGIMIERNPGVMAIWATRSYRAFKAPGGFLIDIGPLEGELQWFTEGRPATRAEVMAAIEAGLPTLIEACHGKQIELDHLEVLTKGLLQHGLPKE